MILRKLILATMVAGFSLGIVPAQALDIKKVQLGIKVAKGASCPRKATLKLWAHTDGPGAVKFQLQNQSGGTTGALLANAVKGAAGTYLATYTHTINVTTNVKAKYKARASSGGTYRRASNWVTLKATCGPQPRKGHSTTSSSKRKGKSLSDLNRPQPRNGHSTTSSNNRKGVKKTKAPSRAAGKPLGKPIGKSTTKSGAKSVGACKKHAVRATRHGAYSKKGGIASAKIAWRIGAGKKYGPLWKSYLNSTAKKQYCKRRNGFYSCTVSARPCK